MITAEQSATLRTANALHIARNTLLDVRSSIAWKGGEHREIDDIVARIDKLFKQLVP